ncbi:MAG: ferredoxin [Patescibacteria group bacterium]|nr:ferredoxin [Patescibacteria group bacterium]
MKVSIDEEKCIGCGACEGMCSQCFVVEDGISKVKTQECGSCDLKEVASSCPTGAIIYDNV